MPTRTVCYGLNDTRNDLNHRKASLSIITKNFCLFLKNIVLNQQIPSGLLIFALSKLELKYTSTREQTTTTLP